MRAVAIVILFIVLGGIGGAIWWLEQDEPQVATGDRLPHQVDVNLPSLSPAAAAGAKIFAANCQICHGVSASGGPGGPPLIHKIYEPSHHADGSFFVAVRNGVRQHHWSFGNMPPVPGISEAEIGQIISYVREVQRANGIN